MRVLGFIFVSLVIAFGLVGSDILLPGTFLAHFLDNNFIETFAGLIGFNIAAVIFLVGQLMNIEDRLGGKVQFTRTRKEIKHNAYFLLSSFVACLILLVMRPDLNESLPVFGNILYYLDNVAILTLFALAIFAIYEILRTVFLITSNDLKPID